MTETLIAVVVGGLLTGIVSYFVNMRSDRKKRERDEKEREQQRKMQLRANLEVVVNELEAASASRALDPSSSEKDYWPPIRTSGFDNFIKFNLLWLVPEDTKASLLRTYSYFYQINHYINSTPLDLWRYKGHAQAAIRPLREPCLEAIKGCVSAIKNFLAEMRPTDR